MEMRRELVTRCNNVHTFFLEPRYKVVIHSKEVEQQLCEKKVFMIKNREEVIIWSLKKYMKEDQFKKIVDEIILTKCRKRVIVFMRELRKKGQRSTINHYLRDFFNLF